MPYEEPAKNLYMPGRQEAAKQAEAWTAHQAERLGISPEAIETAIKRGWTPDLLDKVQNPVELLLAPPVPDAFGLRPLKVVR